MGSSISMACHILAQSLRCHVWATVYLRSIYMKSTSCWPAALGPLFDSLIHRDDMFRCYEGSYDQAGSIPPC